MTMTQKEIRHTKRVLRVLRTAARELETLVDKAIDSQTFPKTTQKAFIELLAVEKNTQIRIAANDASVI